jgi:hypothetical protein
MCECHISMPHDLWRCHRKCEIICFDFVQAESADGARACHRGGLNRWKIGGECCTIVANKADTLRVFKHYSTGLALPFFNDSSMIPEIFS